MKSFITGELTEMNRLALILASVISLDAVAERYQVEVFPEEALDIVRRLPPIGRANGEVLGALVQHVNRIVKPRGFEGVAAATHTFRLGRDGGRLLIIDLFKGFHPVERVMDVYVPSIRVFARESCSASLELSESRMSTELIVRWD